MQGASAYFKKNQKEVVDWWNPEKDIAAEIYERGLSLVIEELQKRGVKEVLDAACGKGRAAKKLVKNFNVTLVDISRKMLNIACSLKLPNIKGAIEADVSNLPFKNNSFDAVVFLATAVHIDNLRKVFQEFNRILRPSGILIFDIDNKFGAIRILKNITNSFFVIFDKKYRNERAKRRQIFKPLSASKVIGALQKSGFTIEKKLHLGILMPFCLKNKVIISRTFYNKIKPLAHFLENLPLIKGFSTYIYFVCRK